MWFLDVSWLLRGEHRTGFVNAFRPLHALHARRNSIERDGRLQEHGIDVLTGVFLFLRAVSFGPCLALVGLASVLKPHGDEFDIPESVRFDGVRCNGGNHIQSNFIGESAALFFGDVRRCIESRL